MQARDQHEDWLMQQPGVEGTAIEYDRKGRLCLKIMTNQVNAQLQEKIRARLKGVPLFFEETGPIEAQAL